MTAVGQRIGEISHWWVSRQGQTVGPVDTQLLLRGVESGRIPDDAFVIASGWKHWRRLGEVREVSAWRRCHGENPAPHDELLRLARDAGEALLGVLHAAERLTRARFGIVQRYLEDRGSAMIVCAYGPEMLQRLGRETPPWDVSLEAALRGRIITAKGDHGQLARALGEHLTGGSRPLKGVAMVPIFANGELCATVELGRSDHPFRNTDRRQLAQVAKHAEHRLRKLALLDELFSTRH